MIQELTITKVYISDKDKSSRPFVTKNGNQYTKVGIKVDYADYEGKWLSHLAFRSEDPTLQLKEGQRVKLKITTNGEYINFDVPNRSDLLEERIVSLEKKIDFLMKSESVVPEKEIRENSNGHQENDIPF